MNKDNNFSKKKNEPTKKVVVNVKPEIQPTPILKPKRPSRKKVEEKVEEKIVEKSARPMPRKEKKEAFVEAFAPEIKEEKIEDVIEEKVEDTNVVEEEIVASFTIWDGAKLSLVTFGLAVSYIIGYFVGSSYCLG